MATELECVFLEMEIVGPEQQMSYIPMLKQRRLVRQCVNGASALHIYHMHIYDRFQITCTTSALSINCLKIPLALSLYNPPKKGGECSLMADGGSFVHKGCQPLGNTHHKGNKHRSYF